MKKCTRNFDCFKMCLRCSQNEKHLKINLEKKKVILKHKYSFLHLMDS